TEVLEAVLPAVFATVRVAGAVTGRAGVRAAALRVDAVRVDAVRVAVVRAVAPPVSGLGLAFAGALPAADFAAAFGRLVREEALEVSFFVATDLPLGRTGPAPMAGLEFVCPSMLPPGRATGRVAQRLRSRHGSKDAAAK